VGYGHFFAAMGTKVTIIEMAKSLLQDEEPEIGQLLEKKMRERMAIQTDTMAQEVKKDKSGLLVTTRDGKTGSRDKPGYPYPPRPLRVDSGNAKQSL